MRFNGRMTWVAGLTLGLATLASGCTSISDHRGYMVDETLLSAIQPGVDNRSSVERTLGRPTFTSQFGDTDWYYVSMDTETPAFRRARTRDQTVLRVRFDQAGNVIGVDERGIEQVARINPESDKTETLGRDRSFLEDLFGNVGSLGGMGGAPGGAGPN